MMNRMTERRLTYVKINTKTIETIAEIDIVNLTYKQM